MRRRTATYASSASAWRPHRYSASRCWTCRCSLSLSEHLQVQHLLALYRCGRQAEALEAYVAVRRRIVDTVGAEPGPELRSVHEAILHHNEAIAAPADASPAASPHRR